MFLAGLAIIASVSILYLALLMIRYPHLRRMAWRNIWKQKQATLLTMLGLAVSTAIISMTLIASLSLHRNVDQNVEKHFGNIAYDLPSTNQPNLSTTYFDPQIVQEIKVTESGEVLPIVSYPATFIKKSDQGNMELYVPHVYTLGVDWAAAVHFDSSLAALNTEELETDEVILSESAAAKLEAQAGQSVYVLDALNNEQQLKVKKVVPERGLTGYLGIHRANTTVIVSLETARRLIDIHEKQYTNLLLTTKISSEWKAESVRASYERELKEAINFLTIIFGTTSFNAILIGIALTTNIFKLIAEERRKEMGLLRAIGLGSSDLRKLLTIEGLLYGTYSGIIGVAIGWLFAYTLIGLVTHSIAGFISLPDDGYQLSFDVEAVLAGFSISLLIVFGCVWFIARKAINLSIVEALQVQIHTSKMNKRQSLKHMWLSITASITALSLAALSAAPEIRQEWITDDRIPFIIIAIFLCIPILVVLITWWLPYMSEGIQYIFRHSARISLPMRLAFRNINTNRFRTGLILLMFTAISCFISFPIVYNHSMSLMLQKSDPKDLTGGFDLVARDGRPLDTEEIIRHMHAAGRFQHKDTFQLAAVQQLIWREVPEQWGAFFAKINGIDASFAESNDILLYIRDPRFASDREAWRELVTNEDVIILGEDALSYTNGSTYRVGDQFPIQVGNKRVTKLIIATAEVTGYHPESYSIWTNRSVLADLAKGENEIHSTIFIKLPEQADSSITKEIKQSLSLQNIYPVTNIVESENGYYILGIFIIGLLLKFNMIALGIGMIGLIVVMYRLVRQRRQQLGLLRTVGVPAVTVFLSVLLEGFFIGFFGITLGFSAGTYMSYIVFDTLFSQDMIGSLSLPILDTLLFFSAALALTILFSYFPARKALRVSPIEATRLRD